MLKRSNLGNPDKYPLYIFLIIAGCIVGGLIGFSVVDVCVILASIVGWMAVILV
jgi:hypothetical protein